MAEFYVSTTDYDMAMQIANMLNRYNQWGSRFSATSIVMTPARYFVELEGSIVVGCASHLQEHNTLTKIQHICVLPTHRQGGIAKKLTNLAITHCETEFVYMTIREDNIGSLKLAQSADFVYVAKHWFRDHWTLTFGRKRDHVGTQKAGSM